MVIDESRLQPCTCKILWQVKSELAVDNCEANEPQPDQFIKGKPGGFQSRKQSSAPGFSIIRS